jgi:hypothetical protein
MPDFGGALCAMRVRANGTQRHAGATKNEKTEADLNRQENKRALH